MEEDVTERTWDAVVVGAGPAGSIAALELARRGASVLLVDKATFPRAKVCGCCLNGAALAALDAIGLGHIPKECGAVPLRSMTLAAGRRSAELRMPAGVALSREAFDLALVREAQAAGATFAPGTNVKVDGSTISLADGRNLGSGSRQTSGEVSTDDGSLATSATKLTSRIVLLATGLAGSHTVQEGSRIGGGIVVPADRVPEFFRRGTIYMATGRCGYVGLVRLEDDRLDIAAAFDAEFVRTSGGLGAAAEAILAQTDWPAIPGLAESGERRGVSPTCSQNDTSGLRLDARQLPWKGTPTLTRRPATVAGHRFFAVGDAAGYVEPFTGEGMAWAIASATALAPIAHRAIEKWDDRLIGDWQRTHARIVGRRQAICRVAARVLRSPRLTGIAVRALSALPILARPIVALLNRPAPQNGRLA